MTHAHSQTQTGGVDSVARQHRLTTVLSSLQATYPQAGSRLNHTNRFQLLIASILSGQSSDAEVNAVTPNLFARYPTPEALARASRRDVEAILHPLGFTRQKARYIVHSSQMIVRQFGGEVPATLRELVQLTGVARKTANLVLAEGFDRVEGIAVDSHVRRVARRLHFARGRSAESVERELIHFASRGQWYAVSILFAHHGRMCCTSRKPRCGACVVADLCPSRRQS